MKIALYQQLKGKDTSMWLSIESLKNNDSDAIVSAGNTGALFVIAKLNLKMIEKLINLPCPLAAKQKRNEYSFRFRCNIKCNEKFS